MSGCGGGGGGVVEVVVWWCGGCGGGGISRVSISFSFLYFFPLPTT